MLAADLLLRLMHIFGAIILVGGTIFMRCSYRPATGFSAEPTDESQAVRRTWARLVMISSGLLLISGLVNFVLIMQRYDIVKTEMPGQLYQMLFGIKFLLALAVFFLSAALSGRSKLAEALKPKEKTWLTLNLVLAILIVCMASAMKLSDRTPKSTTPEESAATFVHQTLRG